MSRLSRARKWEAHRLVPHLRRTRATERQECMICGSFAINSPLGCRRSPLRYACPTEDSVARAHGLSTALLGDLAGTVSSRPAAACTRRRASLPSTLLCGSGMDARGSRAIVCCMASHSHFVFARLLWRFSTACVVGTTGKPACIATRCSEGCEDVGGRKRGCVQEEEVLINRKPLRNEFAAVRREIQRFARETPRALKINTQY